MMTQKEAYVIMNCWQSYEGEDFFEYFIGNEHNIVIPKLVLWMYKKDYIDLEKLNKYAEKYINAKSVWNQPDYEVLLGNGQEYSLFPYGECDDIARYKAMCILSEYIVMQDEWCQRLYNFAYKGNGWSTIDGEDTLEVHKRICHFNSYIQSWEDGDIDDFDKVSKLNIKEINDTLENLYKQRY